MKGRVPDVAVRANGGGGTPDAVGHYHLSRANSDDVKCFKQLRMRRNGGSTVERVGFIICDHVMRHSVLVSSDNVSLLDLCRQPYWTRLLWYGKLTKMVCFMYHLYYKRPLTGRCGFVQMSCLET